MEENRSPIPQEETPGGNEETKHPWQQKKEGWYDKVPLTLKQLDAIIVVCWVLLGLTVVAIVLEAMGVIRLFG